VLSSTAVGSSLHQVSRIITLFTTNNIFLAFWQYLAVCGSIWQYVAVCGSIWQYVAVFGSMWQYFLPTRPPGGQSRQCGCFMTWTVEVPRFNSQEGKYIFTPKRGDEARGSPSLVKDRCHPGVKLVLQLHPSTKVEIRGFIFHCPHVFKVRC